ncbi:HNH endonuclease [Bacillus paramycoides]|uniref:HNH endonuclease n=1 Tax=Bacillus paramycoides TaxID=2026194 RepID=UPI003D015D1C
MNIQDLLASLPPEHKHALSWFVEHAGEGGVPHTPKVNGIPIVSPGQGIFKPKNSDYVLSVKETLKEKYPDQEPVIMPDGSWYYAYHQRGDDSVTTRDTLFDNRDLTLNMKNSIPVGVVLEQSPEGRKKRYKINIALPVAWVNGFFILAGPSPTGKISEMTSSPGEMLAHIVMVNENRSVKDFDPQSITDERRRSLRLIVQRQGQPAFRKDLLNAYECRCPISGCNVEQALEAAHIFPYTGPDTNCVQNGAPLRADLHTLWDRGYIYVDSANMTVVVHPNLLSSHYGKYHGTSFDLPNDPNNHPSKLALDAHRDFCGF